MANDLKSRIYNIGRSENGSAIEKIEIPIVMAANSAYLPYAAVSICNAERFLASYINHLYARAHFSKEMYFRWWIGELFPEYDKALYLDCDTVVCHDLTELYQEDIQDAAVARRRRFCHTNSLPPHFRAAWAIG